MSRFRLKWEAAYSVAVISIWWRMSRFRLEWEAAYSVAVIRIQ